MKFSTATLARNIFLGLVLLSGWGRTAIASDATAFDLLKKADDYVGKEARDQVVQIRSDRSVGTLEPNIWYVVFYDPDATFKATEVKFGAGQKMAVTRPLRVLELAKADKVFDRSKLKVDSDDAIKAATSDPLLKSLTIKETQLWLDSNYKMDVPVVVTAPTWRVRLWAAKLSNPNDSVDIGELFISADDGKVLKTDLHIDRVD